MDISSDAIRGYIDIIILGLLAERDMYGYEIAKEVLSRTNSFYELNEATMYSSFRRLENVNYINSYFSENNKVVKRRYYHLLPLGKKYYSDKCIEWESIKKIVDLFILGGINNEKN